jgi:hypothetical protein
MPGQARFELYFFGALLAFCIASGVYFAFHRSRNRTPFPIVLLCVATLCAFAGTLRAWRKSVR